MDAAGLAIGLVGLPNDLLDLHERWDLARDFDSQYRQALDSWDYSRIRLRDWISHSGFDGDVLQNEHHPRLDDADVLSNVKNSFENIRSISSWLKKKQEKLRISSSHAGNPSVFGEAFLSPPARGNVSTSKWSRSASPARGFLSWAMHGKQFRDRLTSLDAIVDHLFELTPRFETSQVDGAASDDDTEDSLPQIIKLLQDLQQSEHEQLEKYMLQRKQINEWLNIPRVDQEYDRLVSSRLHGTCDWIFRHPSYASWLAPKTPVTADSRVLWIHGPPGFGKTTLCAHVVDSLKKTCCVAYAFCSAFVQAGAKPDVVPQIWLSQLVHHNAIAHEIAWQYLTTTSSATVASQVECWRLLETILAEIPGCFLVVDGLDEFDRAEDRRSDVLHRLRTAITHSDARVLITSREDISPEISSAYKGVSTPLFLDIALSEKDVREDIRKFSDHIVRKKLPNQREESKHGFSQEMVHKAGGMFLWIKMQENQLEDYKGRAVLEKIVSRMPKGLHHVYERTWENIEHFEEDDQERAVAILRWATFAFKPLTISELTEALLIGPETRPEHVCVDDVPSITEDYINRGVRALCGSFLEIRAGAGSGPASRDAPEHWMVHIVHPSARDFILSPRKSNNLASHVAMPLSDAALQHRIVATICLRFLQTKQVWYRPFSSFLEYAIREWPNHARASGEETPDLTNCILGLFFQRPYCFNSWRSSFVIMCGESGSADGHQGGPLYFAALFNLTATMNALRSVTGIHLNGIGGRYGTALQAACAKGHQESFEILVQWGVDVNVQAGLHGSALITAIAHRHEELALRLVDSGADPDRVMDNKSFPSALHAAVFLRLRTTVELLLRTGVEASTALCDRLYSTPLLLATSRGDAEITKLLLQYHADVNTSDVYGRTPLHAAVASDNVEIVELLLHHHANPNKLSNIGISAFHYAVQARTIGVAKLLLDHGADPIMPTMDGFMPIHLAASWGVPETLQILLDNGVELGSVLAHGATPLHAAIWWKNSPTAAYLLGKGANSSAQDTKGLTPMKYAVAAGQFDLVQLMVSHGADPISTWYNEGSGSLTTFLMHGIDFRNTGLIDFLLESGCPTEDLLKSGDFLTPLNQAAAFGSMRLLEHVVDQFPNQLFSADRHGMTALHLAASKGNMEAFNLLLDRGLDTAARDLRGNNLLHFAAISASVEMVQRVLALPNAADFIFNDKNWTPLHWACRRGVQDVIDELIRVGTQDAAVEVVELSGSFTAWNIAQIHKNERLLSEKRGRFLFGEQTRLPQGPVKRNGHDLYCDACNLGSIV